MTFQQIITKLQRDSGFNKGDFAEMVGISYQTFYNYYTGQTEPSFSEAKRIVEACGSGEVRIIESYFDEEE